jgi:hypothetical protein
VRFHAYGFVNTTKQTSDLSKFGEWTIDPYYKKEETMMRLHALLFWVLVLAANAAAQENPAAVVEESCSLDGVAPPSDQAVPVDTASTEGEEVPIGGKDSLDQEESATADDSTEGSTVASEEAPPVQTGPLIDIFGPTLLSLQMIDEQHAQLAAEYTSDALRGKKVIGIYFSADWCGPW